MQGAPQLRHILLLFVIAAVFVVAPATALAQAKPIKYALVSATKGCRVTLNTKTGKLTFKTEKGHFGHFAVVVKHGKKKFAYRFTVTRPKVAAKPPVVTVIKSSGTSAPIIIIITVTVSPVAPGSGPTGPPSPGTPTTPPTLTPSPTKPTAAHPPVNLSPPVLTGTPVVGDTITLAYGTWSDSTSQTGTWYDCDAHGKHCSVDANQPSGDLYVVQRNDIGHSLLLAETATGPGGSRTVDSQPTGIVTPPPPPLLNSPPVLSGEAQVGQTLTLTVGVWGDSTSQDGIWMDCNAAGTVCTPIAGQPTAGFGESYVVQLSDIGQTILVVETATGKGGTSTVDSNQTAVVTGAPTP
jgi:hypothetical protein